MKISLKIFVFTYCMIVAVTMFGGFFLIQHEYQRSLEQVKKEAFEENELLFDYVAVIEDVLDRERAEVSLHDFLERIKKEEGQQVLIGDQVSLSEMIKKGRGEALETMEWKFACYMEQGRYTLQVTSRYKDRYIINTADVHEIIERRNDNFMLYKNMIFLISSVMAVLLYLFTYYITRPLVKVAEMADRLSVGDYTVRINADYKRMKSYEAKKLGETLNIMADRTQTYIRELEEEAARKEEFMGNFAHELKTPMTSIVGYADLLRTYDLSPEKRRVYSDFIYKESRRLEQLSIHLLQLIVLGKQDYTLVPVSATELFEHLKKECLFLEKKYQVQVQIQYDAAELVMEKALMLTAVLNLIDNACKASKVGDNVYVYGKKREIGYEISVEDKGIGMHREELEKITEPFYMADKSRTRINGGAGLGLSLCKRIAELHKAELHVESVFGEGTKAVLVWEKGAGIGEA